MRIFRHFAQASNPCIATIGNYDGIHLGHQSLINHVISESRAKHLESAIITFEPHPKEYFQPKAAPKRVISLREKLEFFHSHKLDRVYVIRFDDNFANLVGNDFIEILQTKLLVEGLVVGDDFRFGKKRQFGIIELKHSGIQVTQPGTIFLNNERISSSRVRNALQDADFDHVESLLGRPYVISGRVIHGEKKARLLGYPTANIHMFHKSPPLSGVFAVKLDSFFGVANLGLKPTFGGVKNLVLEVHLFDFDKNIYGKHVHVTFFKKIRDEKRFSSSNELSSQIASDVNHVKDFFNL
ncbi:MAG: bifunctional riboflavin kinase/FAD synthetase [Methylophilaceae bacterium]|jgi:riboflavin kinase/FMN adenylyltransferase|nr:bifunctional riboflavin kinase/FAD synthetase [Methylophilaceae bacterium]NCV38481.1 bifunctional riboflavin kinase/FAD synthetase [Betaproteobacteria bacterium]NCV53950.1 bifunctional riboflavin kinase/FAD synthetase [Betaproteobacteria bacterium]NCX68257.1 bifunctional riboflavin kinase/FAD synthetase [Betaproteobacteria bacterium]